MKKILATLAVIIVAMQAWAFSFSSVTPSGQTLYFNITSAMIPGMPLTVAVTHPGTSNSNPYSGYTKPIGNLTIPSTVSYNGSTYTVTEIGDYAFSGCTNLTGSLNLPTTITRIGHYAFCGCTGFSESLTLPDGITAIETYAFQNCHFTGALVLPSSLSTISDWSFAGCTGFTSVTFPSGISCIGNHAFDDCDGLAGALTIPDAVASIGWRAFYDCDQITSVNTGNGVQNIYYGAFCHCSALTSLVIGDQVRRIYDFAFFGCDNLTTVVMGQNIDSIDYSAFEKCTSLAAITMRNSTPPTMVTASSSYRPDPSLRMTEDKGAWEEGEECCYSDGSGENYYHIYKDYHRKRNIIHICGDRNCEPDETVTHYGSYGRAYYDYYIYDATYRTPNGERVYNTTFNGVTTSLVYLHVPCSAVMSYQVSPYWGNSFNLQGFMTYAIQVQSADNTKGTAMLTQWPTCANPNAIITAIANEDYHFKQWNDGNSDNPRTIGVNQDTSLTAIFASNWISINAVSNNENYGTTSGGGNYYYNTPVTIQASPAAHYHFVSWSDGNTENPRTIVADEDLNIAAFFAIDQHILVTNANNNDRESVTGGGTYDYGISVFISATPNTGYFFTQWNDGSTNNPRNVTVTSDTSFTAQFGVYSYNIVVAANNPAQGTVTGGGTYDYATPIVLTATPNNTFRFVQWGDGNTENPRTVTVTGNAAYTAIFAPLQHTITVLNSTPSMGQVSGNGTYNLGDTAVLSAVPNMGYHFVQWNDGVTLSPRKVQVVCDAIYTAFFAPNSYTITANSNNTECGTVSGSGIFDYNATATISATANYGYHFVQWIDGDISNPRTIIVTNDANYTAQFAPNSYSLTVSSIDTTKGTVSGGGSYEYNSSAVLTATAFNGYHFTQWNDGNTQNSRTVLVSQDASYQAFFAPNSYTITANSNNIEYGAVSGSGIFDYNTTATISATANYGYHFVQWTDGNTSNPRTITVTNDANYTAQFAPNSYTLAVSSIDTTKGTVSGGGSYEYNSSAVLTATAFNGYHFTQWNDGNTQNSRTVLVSQDASYQAFFAANTYNITVSSADSTQGTVSGGGSYEHGSQAILQAIPAQHHHFVQWNDGSTSNPRVVTVLQDMAFSAQFEADGQYVLTVVSDDSERGSVTGGGTFYIGEQTTITANAFEHYIFDHWSDGSTSNPKTVTIIDNVTYTAYFVGTQHMVSVFSNDNNLGTVAGNGSYEYGSSVMVTATPTAGNHFVRWSNGAEENPYTFTVYGDVNLIATFAEGVGIRDIDKKDWYLFSQNGNIILRNTPAGEYVRVYDLLGKLLYTVQSAEESEIVIPVQTAGVYLVRIGTQSVKKVVVTK